MAERSLVSRMVGAAFLDVDTYEEVEHDDTLTGQAAAVVFMAAVAQTIGSLSGGLLTAAGAGVGALVGWGVWSGITYLIGDKVLGGTATWGEMLRAIGFAHAPGLLMLFAFLPFLGWSVMPVVGVWMLAAAVVAVRQALDFGTGKAIATVLLGWLAMGFLRVLF